MPPKKAIAFGKIGSLSQLSLNPSRKESAGDDVGGFGKFSTKSKEDDFTPEPTEAVKEVMGFQGFGKGKAAKEFDIESLVEQNKQTAREIASQKKVDEPEASTSEANKEAESEDEEDVVGPMPPPPPPAEPHSFKTPKYLLTMCNETLISF